MTGPSLGEIVRDICLPLVDTVIDDGAIRRHIIIVPEFSCFDGCVKGSDRCTPGAGGFHGQGSRRIMFAVSVPAGGVAFELHTPITVKDDPRYLANWHPLGPVTIHYADGPEYLRELGWGPNECTLTGTGECWSDVTYMAAEDAVAALVADGPKGVWAYLAETRLPDILAATP